MKILKQNKAITLIALIITIIVMLILVAVTITIAVNGGLFNYAREAGTKTNGAMANEQKMADGLFQIDGDWVDIAEYTGTIDFDAILADAEANPDKYLEQARKLGQDTTTNQDIGIGTDGKVVNLDLWYYTYKNEECVTEEFGTININGYVLNELVWDDDDNWYRIFQSGYKGEVENGKIKGKIPQYIKKHEDEEFIPVVSLLAMFYLGNSEIEVAPNFPETVRDISGAFTGCTNLKMVTIPDGINTIGCNTFSRCTALESIVISRSVKTIGDNAFGGCTSLKTVTMPNSVTSIGQNTFYNCTSLETVTIPNSVTTIGTNAFYNVPEVKYSGTLSTDDWGALSVVSE